MRSTFICLGVLIANIVGGSFLSAQEISYKVLEDDPSKVRSKFIALEFLNADIGGKQNVNTISVGANGIYSLGTDFGVEARLNYALVKEDGLPACFQIQAGVFKGFLKSSTKKDIKVRVGGEFATEENKQVYNEKFILVPGTHQRVHGVRGGLYLNKKAYKEQGVSGKPEIPYTLIGVYGGWGMTRKSNLVVKINGSSDGNKMPKKPLYYKGLARIYVDAIVTPLASRDYPAAALDAQSTVKNKLIGARTGVMFYKDGPKWFNKFMWGVETGVRPLDGFYFSTSVGYSVFRG